MKEEQAVLGVTSMWFLMVFCFPFTYPFDRS